MRKTLVLIVLDGWGLGARNESNPIYASQLPTFKFLEETYPMTSLEASGINVGLPWGEVGNSEVGHLTIGAGKVLYQHFPRISLAIRNESFFSNQVLKDAFAHARKNNSAIHFVGLLTKGTTHAALEHIQALVAMAGREQFDNFKLHLFGDGKDGPPRMFEPLFDQLPKEKVASIIGRYYAMDREQDWTLTKTAYDTIAGENGPLVESPKQLVDSTYERGMSEEYLPPMRLQADGAIKDNDAVVFFNFREDSIRQLAEAFLIPNFDKFPVKKFANLHVTTFTRYEEKLTAPVAFPEDAVEKPLGWVVAEAGKTQLRLAENYKYAHVTYFFNGYREAPFKDEYRVLIPSVQTPRPAEHPEMMATAITDRLLQALENQSFDFMLVNYANPDTIGHTGNYEAAVAAVKVIDREIGRIVPAIEKSGAILVITSDHGNVERVYDPLTGRAETQHDPNPVPFYLVSAEHKGRSFFNSSDPYMQTGGSLADVAPTVVELMDLPKPPEMEGLSLMSNLI